MSGVFVTPVPDVPKPKPLERPATYGEVWDASRVMARGDRTDADADRLRTAYEPILSAINADRAKRGLKPMVNPGYWMGGLDRRPSADNGTFDFGSMFDTRITRDQQQAEIFGELSRIRARDPQFLKDVPDNLGAFQLALLDREKVARAAARDALGRSSGVGQTLTGFAAGTWETMHDPINVASLPLGGGGKTVLGQIARSALVNGGLELVQQPLVADNRAELGEELTLGEAAQNVGMAAFGGVVGDVVIPHGVKAVGKGVGMAVDAVTPNDVKLARAMGKASLDDVSDIEVASHFAQSVPAEIRTPDESAALHVIDREAEVRRSSPYISTPAALDAHAARLQASMEAILKTNTGEPATPIVSPSAPVSPARVNGQAGVAGDIVSFFQAKGYSEAQARGIAAGIAAEASSSHAAVNPKSGALGLGQWLGPRKAELIRRYGPNPSRAEQLEFLHSELQGGDAGGKAVLAQNDETAVLDAYIRKFMRPAAGAETTGDLARGLAALGRSSEDAVAAMDLGDDVPVLQSPAIDAARPVIGPSGNRIALEQFRPDDIGVDAQLMQFKAGGDQFGVTDRLQGVAEWDPLAAGTVTVWEGADGRRLIADGHQRLGLAKRIAAADPASDVRLNAFVLREADGISADEARLVTALKNIGEGTGSSTDAAKIFRDGGQAAMEQLARRLPPRSPLVRDGKALSRLSPEAFGAIVNDVVPESWGAAIGELAPDPATHAGLVSLLSKLQPANRRQAEGIVRQAMQAGFTRETQAELFGGRDTVSSLFLDRARVLDRGLAELRKLKGVFSTAARNADALESAGSSIAVEASQREAADNARALALIERLAYSKGDVADLLNSAAKRLADGERLPAVIRDFVADVRKLDIADLDREAGAATRSGLAADGSGRDLLADDGAGGPLRSDDDSLTPADRDELEAAGQGGFNIFDSPVLKAFDDPDGAGAKLQADSLAHDVRAALEAGDMFGGATAADRRVALERAGEGRAKAGVAQKPPGSEGGLFDAQAEDLTFFLDTGDERTAADLLAALDADQAAIDAVRGCL